jgi:hypothetical protein
LYIYNLILGLLLVDMAINLHESSDKCEVLSSFKDFVDTAITASGARAAAFTVFLALAFFVLCLTAIMSLAEEYKGFFSRMEEDKGNHPLLNQFLIPTVAASVMPLVAMALDFMEGGDLTGAQLSIHDIISKRIIAHHIIQKYEARLASRLGCLFNKHLATISYDGCRNIMCSQTRDRSKCIRASKLNRMAFSPCA